MAFCVSERSLALADREDLSPLVALVTMVLREGFVRQQGVFMMHGRMKE